jgi:hypothetical protein
MSPKNIRFDRDGGVNLGVQMKDLDKIGRHRWRFNVEINGSEIQKSCSKD